MSDTLRRCDLEYHPYIHGCQCEQEKTDLRAALQAAEKRVGELEKEVVELLCSNDRLYNMHLTASLATVTDERDAALTELRRWFGCPACGEDHDTRTMCPPHEVRTTGQAWFHGRIRRMREELAEVTAERDEALAVVAELEAQEREAVAMANRALDERDTLTADLARAKGALEVCREAFRFTREYVGLAVLPAEPGWSWYDADQLAREALANLHPAESTGNGEVRVDI